MEWRWTWSGKCFGYRDGDDLWTHDGRHVGRYRHEVYGADGLYLGEEMNGRLISSIAKAQSRSVSFTPQGRRGGYAKYADYAGYAMYSGYDDFPTPEEL